MYRERTEGIVKPLEQRRDRDYADFLLRQSPDALGVVVCPAARSLQALAAFESC
jgi:hypothetical protein